MSLWQHGGATEPNFVKMRAAGVQFVFIKSSDGLRRGDISAAKWWSIDRPAAHAAGLVVGSYHFAQPTTAKSNAKIIADAKAGARLAASRTGQFKSGYLPTALDLESAPASITKARLTLWTTTWLGTFKQLTGRKPFLYSYGYFLSHRLNPTATLTSYPLWLAEYRKGSTQPQHVLGWPVVPVIWQFTSSGKVSGSGSSAIDLNVFYGSKAQLRIMAKISKAKAARYGLN